MKTFWYLFFILTLGWYLLVSLLVAVGGFQNIRELLRKLAVNSLTDEPKTNAK